MYAEIIGLLSNWLYSYILIILLLGAGIDVYKRQVLIQGIIDAWFEEEDGLILVDYKTDYVNDAQILVKRYKTQLDYYEKALTQMLGRNVKERYIYSYRLGLIAV